jgi:alkylation response protein AidB-like acyl-CoA dehydrogenase
MEVLDRYGTEAQKREWLQPLLEGTIRSCFAMTEPAVASSDATNIESRIEHRGDRYVINGRKWWSSCALDTRCKLFIFMGKTDPKYPDRHKQQSMIIIPRDAKGVKVMRTLPVFGYDDAPQGHGEVLFEDVEVPLTNMLLGEGRITNFCADRALAYNRFMNPGAQTRMATHMCYCLNRQATRVGALSMTARPKPPARRNRQNGGQERDQSWLRCAMRDMVKEVFRKEVRLPALALKQAD